MMWRAPPVDALASELALLGKAACWSCSLAVAAEIFLGLPIVRLTGAACAATCLAMTCTAALSTVSKSSFMLGSGGSSWRGTGPGRAWMGHAARPGYVKEQSKHLRLNLREA